MKAFVKTYWLELLFFALGLVGAAFAFPFLPGSIPRQWNNGQVVATMPGGERLKFPSLQEAGMSLGLSRSYIKRLCTEKGQTKRGIRFEYVYLEDAAELGTS